MTGDAFERTARAWLEDGPTTISDRVVDAALDEIHTTRQRRAWGPARRPGPMNIAMRAIAAAVVVVAVGVGLIGLLPGGAQPAPAAPSPSPSPQPSGAGREFVITFAFQYPYRLHLTAPWSWSGESGDFVINKNAGDPPNGMAIATWIVDNVYRDGCRWAGSEFDPPVGPTVNDLANALASLQDRETTTPVEVTIDGYAGKELEMTVPPDIDFADCDQSQFRSWTSPDGGARFHQGPGEHSRILILDVDGIRVLVFGRTFPGTSAADRAELNAILESMEIEVVAAGPSPSD